MFIYIIENIINNKIYVGISSDPERRWYDHCKPCKRWKSIISNSINKHGRDKFELIILEKCNDLNSAHEQEKYWIKELNTISPNGYNLREGGEAGGIPSFETRQKMSKTRLGVKTGIPRSEEFKQKMSALMTGRTYSSETIERMKLASRLRVTKFKNPMYGKKHSKETLEKMRQARLNNPRPKDVTTGRFL